MSLRTASSIACSYTVVSAVANENKAKARVQNASLSTPPVFMNPSTRLLIEYYVDCFRVAVGLASVFDRHLKQIGKIWGI